MRKNFKDLSLLNQTYLLFGGFLVLAFLNYFLITRSYESYISYYDKFDEVKNLNATLKKLKTWALKAHEDSLLRDNALESIEYTDQVFSILMHGGKLPFKGTDIDKGSKTVTKKILNLKDDWIEIKDAIGVLLFEPIRIDTTVQQSVLVQITDSTTRSEIQNNTISITNKEYKKAENYINIEYAEFEKEVAKIENILRSDQEDADDWLRGILLFFLVFNFTAIIAVIIIIRKFVFVPLGELSKLLSNKRFDKKSEYNLPNELGIIAKSLNQLVDSFQHATSFVRKIGEGNLDVEFEGLKKEDIEDGSLQAALLNMRSQMKKMDEEEAARNWTTEGLAKFVEILRANDNVQELSDQIISNLVEYTKSNQGGIYIINEEEGHKYLELISLYAFTNKKFETKSYRLGEGLVGQTFIEQKTIYLLDVPKDYISIGSGLGDSNPTTILLVPLKIDNDIYGVIELASFHEYHEYQIEFVEKLGESIASTIAGVKANQKTKQLLEESQQLTEQMQAQEEEMRQNMEELTATQEEMGRKELAVNAQIDAINRSLGLIEYSADGSIINANRKLAEALGSTEDGMIDSDFYSLHGSINLFEELREGKSWSGWLDKNHLSGNTVEFKSFFSPVFGDNGDLLKIIEIVTQFNRETQPVTTIGEPWLEESEVEEELRQQMEELEITQEQLNKKLGFSNGVINAFKKSLNMIIMSSDGRLIEISDSLSTSFGNAGKIENIFSTTIAEIKDSVKGIELIFNNEQKTKVLADIVKIDEDKFLITWP